MEMLLPPQISSSSDGLRRVCPQRSRDQIPLALADRPEMTRSCGPQHAAYCLWSQQGSDCLAKKASVGEGRNKGSESTIGRGIPGFSSLSLPPTQEFGEDGHSSGLSSVAYFTFGLLSARLHGLTENINEVIRLSTVTPLSLHLDPCDEHLLSLSSSGRCCRVTLPSKPAGCEGRGADWLVGWEWDNGRGALRAQPHLSYLQGKRFWRLFQEPTAVRLTAVCSACPDACRNKVAWGY